jgi:hypothetical protein
VANGFFRNQRTLWILSLGSVFAAAATAATASDQSPATPPQNAATQPASAQSPAAPAGNSASSAKPADTSAAHKVVLIDNDINDQQLKLILARGYRPESHNGKTVYCRTETPLGTRFATKTCRTSMNILETEQKSKDVTTSVQRNNGNPKGN